MHNLNPQNQSSPWVWNGETCRGIFVVWSHTTSHHMSRGHMLEQCPRASTMSSEESGLKDLWLCVSTDIRLMLETNIYLPKEEKNKRITMNNSLFKGLYFSALPSFSVFKQKHTPQHFQIKSTFFVG